MYTLDQFSKTYRYKMAHNKIKKIEVIKEYFATNYDHTMVAQESEELLLEVISYTIGKPDQEEKIFIEIIEILHDRYSLGTPYQMYDVNLPTNASFDEILKQIRRLFKDPIQRDMFDFLPEQSITIDDTAEDVTIKMRFKEFEKDIVSGARTKTILVSGQIPVYVNIKKKKAIINTGYLKAAKLIAKIINGVIGTTISISQINVESESEQMPNLVANDRFSPLTILAITLILVELNRNNFVLNDLLSISFNNEDAPRVKHAQLGGNHLIQDADVVNRIYRGDRITHFLVSVAHLNSRQAADMTGEILFDFRTGFKLQFGEQTSGVYKKTDAAMDIESIIRTALRSSVTVSNAINAIRTRLPNIPAQDQQMVRDILTEVRTALGDILPNDKLIMEDYLTRTFGL